MRLGRVSLAAAYGTSLLSHEDILRRFDATKTKGSAAPAKKSADFLEAILPPLESVETVIGSWKLNRWENRVPLITASEVEKEAARKQLHSLKALALKQKDKRKSIAADMKTVTETLGVTEKDVREQPRSWVIAEISKLRWNGNVQGAKAVREAWERLEADGSRDSDLLDRLSVVYGLARMGTFEDAFSNMILPTTGKASASGVGQLSLADPFRDIMQLVSSRLPTLDLYYDLSGMNVARGYTNALGRYMATLLRTRDELAKKGADATKATEIGNSVATELLRSDSRLLYRNAKRQELLYKMTSPADTTNPFVLSAQPAPLADYVHIRGSDITLITVANHNKYKRQRQLPNEKQLEGIARRAVFVLGEAGSAISFDTVRVRTLLLPPRFLDAKNLRRIDRVLELRGENEAADVTSVSTVTSSVFPWTSLYAKELNRHDADYAAQAKVAPEEEWKTL